MNGITKLAIICGALLILVAVRLLAAPPSGIYVGGNNDGYDRNIIKTCRIPAPPPKGMVIVIR